MDDCWRVPLNTDAALLSEPFMPTRLVSDAAPACSERSYLVIRENNGGLVIPRLECSASEAWTTGQQGQHHFFTSFSFRQHHDASNLPPLGKTTSGGGFLSFSSVLYVPFLYPTLCFRA